MNSLELSSQPSLPKPEPSKRQENPKFYCKGGYHPVEIGDTFHNRYTAVRKLGWGCFSTVWLCSDLQENRHVALKIMKSASKNAEVALMETNLLNRTQKCDPDGHHKGKIVQLLNTFNFTGINGTHECLVFDVLGDNLLKWIRRSGKKGLPLKNVKIIIKQVLEALDYLHTNCGIIHTDIKPENICATEELKVTLADLGNACWINCHFAKTIQSRPYRCPEVILKTGYNPKADIWSAACVAFELATGNFLFQPRSGANYTQNEDHLALIIELLGDVSKEAIFKGERSRKYFNNEGKLINFPEIESCGVFKLLVSSYQWGEDEASQFADFLLPMLAFDQNDRVSARDSLKHKWFDG